LPVPADVEQVARANGLIEGMRPDSAYFDMSTNSVSMVRKIHAAFAEKNLYMLDCPVSAGIEPLAADPARVQAVLDADKQK
jgi:3-hydroxyisobutyrate dehydrogenase-like beta-hydroxyacid dehydrogenase